MDKTSKNNTVCVKHNNQYHYNDLKEKIEWLRPYYSVVPLITTVINKMDDILEQLKSTLLINLKTLMKMQF